MQNNTWRLFSRQVILSHPKLNELHNCLELSKEVLSDASKSHQNNSTGSKEQPRRFCKFNVKLFEPYALIISELWALRGFEILNRILISAAKVPIV